jgi:hypothetical protein
LILLHQGKRTRRKSFSKKYISLSFSWKKIQSIHRNKLERHKQWDNFFLYFFLLSNKFFKLIRFAFNVCHFLSLLSN